MSSRAILTVGHFQFEFDHTVPSFPLFGFVQDDFYIVEPNDEQGYAEYGYRTSVAGAMRALDSFGFSDQLLGEVYRRLKADVSGELELALRDHKAEHSESNASTRAERAVRTSRANPDDLDSYVATLQRISNPRAAKQFFKGTCELDAGPPVVSMPWRDRVAATHTGLTDPVSVNEYIALHPTQTSLGVANVAHVLLARMQGRYPWGPPDVVDLLWFRLLLRASARGADVIYELDDIIDDPDVAQRVRAEAVEEAAAAIAFHDRIFRILMEGDSGLRGGVARALATDLLERSAVPQAASAKGRLLEDLTEAIFVSDAGFVIQSKNVNRGDEEVDLIVRNNVPQPFWIGLHSPLLFVECKHWSKRVGAKELRDFEGKLRNHGQLVRIGILIAPGGITRECREAARRMSRDSFTVVLVTEEDLRRFAFASLSTTEWLGDMIARLP